MTNEPYLPYTRVNHAKFMVTEKQVYIGTSNWSADYFLSTGLFVQNIKEFYNLSRRFIVGSL